MKEALRYLNNAREILKSTPVDDHIYTDIKLVREAFATAYIAILEAINEYLLKKGVDEEGIAKVGRSLSKDITKTCSCS